MKRWKSIVLLLVSLFSTACASRHLLLLGDSVDRNAQHDWCNRRNKVANAENTNLQRDFGDASIKYGGHVGVQKCPAMCFDPASNNSVAMVHLYGSNADEPYYTPASEEKHPLVGNNRSTLYRVKASLAFYRDSFGHSPTAIFLNTIIWDSHAGSVKIYRYADPPFDFRANTIALVKAVRAEAGRGVLVGLRTSPISISKEFSSQMKEMNAVYRDLFANGLVDLLFDYDKDVWSLVNFEYNWDNRDILLKDDGRHPQVFFQGTATEKMLGRLFSQNYLIFRKVKDETKFFSDEHLDVRLATTKSDKAAEGVSVYYYISRDPVSKKRIKWSGVPSLAFASSCLHVGPGDVLTLPLELLNSMETREMPAILFFNETHKFHAVETTSGALYITREKHCSAVSLPNTSLFPIVIPEFRPENIIRNVDDFWFYDVKIFQNTFQDGSLVRLFNDKTIYLVRENARLKIPSLDVFVSHGYDFDQVKVVEDPFLLDILPLAGSLEMKKTNE